MDEQLLAEDPNGIATRGALLTYMQLNERHQRLKDGWVTCGWNSEPHSIDQAHSDALCRDPIAAELDEATRAKLGRPWTPPYLRIPVEG